MFTAQQRYTAFYCRSVFDTILGSHHKLPETTLRVVLAIEQEKIGHLIQMCSIGLVDLRLRELGRRLEQAPQLQSQPHAHPQLQ